MIKTFFIMHSSGLILFSDDYIQSFQIDLVSGFISALFTLMREAVFSEEIDSIDVGEYRFLFNIQDIGEDRNETLIYVVLIDRKDNLANYKPKLERVKWIFLEEYYSELKNWSGEQSIFDKFKYIERKIFSEKEVKINTEKESELLKGFEKLYSLTEFAIGAALITQTGDILLSFIESKLLNNILKIIEGRFHSGFINIDTIISKEKDGILVLIGGKKLITAVLFRKDTQWGTALLLGQNFADSINKIIN